MDITFLELRREPGKILRALERNESISLTRRGIPIARIVPVGDSPAIKPSEHEAVGMWADRDDMKDPTEYIRQMRKGRFDDL